MAGLSGRRAEQLKLLLQDLEALELLTEAATSLAQANAPADVVAGSVTGSTPLGASSTSSGMF